MKIDKEITEDLLRIQAVQINTEDYFTWTSGLKSPIYCDNRLTISAPNVRRRITDAFIKKISQLEEKPDVIAGCATAGIPHAAWLANALDLPLVYVRSKAKGHGKQNQIEGAIEPGQKVVVIEDLISTGSSAIQAAQALKEVGANVIRILAIFTYGLHKSEQAFEASGFEHDTITTYDLLASVLEENKQITKKEKETLLSWRKSIDV